jgi:hypothetical protein
VQHAALTPVLPQYVAALCGQAGLCSRAATPRRANIPLYRLTIYAWPGQDAHPNSQRPWRPKVSEKQHTNRGNVLDRSWILRMHCAARAWPLNEPPPLTGTSSGDRRSEDTQLRRGNAQRLLLGGNAGALLVFTFQQQLRATLDFGSYSAFRFNESCFSFSFHGGSSYLPRVASK